MHINKEYLKELRNLIRFTPERCHDGDLLDLLNFTESLIIEYEELRNEYSALLTSSTQHTDMLRGQLITSMLNKGSLNKEDNGLPRGVKDDDYTITTLN